MQAEAEIAILQVVKELAEPGRTHTERLKLAVRFLQLAARANRVATPDRTPQPRRKAVGRVPGVGGSEAVLSHGRPSLWLYGPIKHG